MEGSVMSNFDDSLAPAMVASEQCSNCANKAKDVAIGGKVLIAGYTKGICSAYPDGKPLAVLDGERCEYLVRA